MDEGDGDTGQRSNQPTNDVIKQESEEEMDLGEDIDTDEEREVFKILGILSFRNIFERVSTER